MDRQLPQPITRALTQVKRFQEEVLGCTLPEKPTMLDAEAIEFIHRAAGEELMELSEATTVEDQADALIDLAYFTFGRLVRMGLMPSVLFDLVHEANMSKRSGELRKHRSLPGEREAVKPPGWKPPNLVPYLVSREQIEKAAEVMMWGPEVLQFDQSDPTQVFPKPTDWHPLPPVRARDEGFKIIVIGHARHGKDTVAEKLAHFYDLPFTSSSAFCAERVIMPLTRSDDLREEFEARLAQRLTVEGRRSEMDGFHHRIGEMVGAYANRDECYADRHRDDLMRATWFEAIRDFNRTDQAALAKAIFEENDVYCGLRSKQELRAAVNSGTADLVVWVDASDRMPLEPATSITVREDMAHYTIDNNGTLEELDRNIRELFDTLGFKAVR